MAKTWTDEITAELVAKVDALGVEVVSQADVKSIAEDMGLNPRSVGAKLRKLNYTVEKASAKASPWTPELEDELRNLLNSNPGVYTYSELETVFGKGFTSKQLQGKVLNLELTHLVKKAEKRQSVRTYTEAEDAQVVQMINDGAFLEDIAAALNRTLPQIRGKALSLQREGKISTLPAQRDHKESAVKADAFEGLDIPSLTVAEICEATGKVERSVKSMLTRRALSAKDYDGAARAEKAAAKREKAE